MQRARWMNGEPSRHSLGFEKAAVEAEFVDRQDVQLHRQARRRPTVDIGDQAGTALPLAISKMGSSADPRGAGRTA